MSGILLSPQHGVNPSVGQCFLCHKDFEVILFGRMKGDMQAPHEVCMGPNHVCPECEEWMKKGVIMISVDPEKSTPEAPWHTGGWIVLKEEAVERLRGYINSELIDHALKKRAMFIEDEAWDMLGLPRGEVDGVPTT